MKKKIFITGIVRDYDSADQQRLADEIKAILDETGFPAEMLEVEVTDLLREDNID